MFDYYKAWDKFAVDKEDDDGEDSDKGTGEFIPAKNPKFEADKPAQSQA